MKKFTILILFMFLLSSFVFAAQKDWTVMVYICGDNDLDSILHENEVFSLFYGNVTGLEAAADPDNVNMIVLYDRWSGEFEYGTDDMEEPILRPDENKGMTIYYIEPDSDMDQINSREITTELGFQGGTFDGGDAKNLEKFILSVIDKYPAEQYHLDIGTHGAGVHAVNTDYSSDTSMNLGNEQENSFNAVIGKIFGRLVSKIQDKNPSINLDILSFDACLMSMVEVYTDLSVHDVSYGVGSEQTIPGPGFDYAQMFKDVTSRTPENQTRHMVSEYTKQYRNGAHLSSIKLDNNDFISFGENMGEFFAAANSAYEGLKESDPEFGTIFMKEFHKVLTDTRKFQVNSFIDIVDFLDNAQNNEYFNKLLSQDDLYNRIKNSHDALIVANGHGWGDSSDWKNSVNGLSMFMPKYYITLYAVNDENGEPQIVDTTSNGNIDYGATLAGFDFAASKMYEEASKFVDAYLSEMEAADDDFFEFDDDYIVRWLN
ncbi:MAG: clostripain-related cysteine peptidase [Candidatus Muiribacteriota bacterium]